MKTHLVALICLAGFSAVGADIEESTSVQQFPNGPRTTVTYRRGDNIVLLERTFEKTPGESFTHVYDFAYLGQIYASYFIGPKSRDKTVLNQHLGDLERSLTKNGKEAPRALDAGEVKSLKNELAHLPSHFSWIDSDGDGRDDRFYFTRYDDETHQWKLLEAYAISADGTVAPVSNKLLQEWSEEYAASANK